ncbi:PKD domain-containing protein [Thermosulfurimonas dismutans]|uniref:PKD domain-containing protein n=1 Tax=Thermosulfurimonas dismutans TaxID=999894 RepID=A0A179D5N2_9BACT|nr:PKD domain-containing protein [Thermosulfurimonas dismutans]OAQ20908.1 hypothetical protein TDIS_1035 [Thermosulfurimonas dismutans]
MGKNFQFILIFLIFWFLFYFRPIDIFAQTEREFYLSPPGSLWGILLDSPPVPEGVSSFRGFYPEKLAESFENGNYYYLITGFDVGFVSTGTRGVLAKINENGNLVFIRSYEPEDFNYVNMNERGNCFYFVTPASDGSGYLLVGDNLREAALWFLKTDPAGEKIWEKSFKQGDLHTWGTKVIEIFNGYYLIGGFSTGGLNPASEGLLTFIEKDNQGGPRGDFQLLRNFGAPAKDFLLSQNRLIIATEERIHILNDDFSTAQTAGNASYYQIISVSTGGYAAVGVKETLNGKLALVVARLDSSGRILWEKTFGENETRSFGAGIVETEDGGFLVVGTWANKDLWLLKISGNGEKVWELIYDGGKIEKGKDIIKTHDGHYLVLGEVSGFSGDQVGTKAWVIKLRGDYNPIYPMARFSYTPDQPIVDEEVTFSAGDSYDPDGQIVSYLWDFGDGNTAEGVRVKHRFTVPGNYTVTLTVTDNESLEDTFSREVKISPMALRWERTYDGRNFYCDVLRAMIPDEDGGWVLTGSRTEPNSSRLCVAKIDRYGNPVYREDGSLWGLIRLYPESLDVPTTGWYASFGRDIIKAPDGGYVILGTPMRLGDHDIWVLKIDDRAQVVWEKLLGGDNREAGLKIEEIGDEGYLIGGITESLAQGGNARPWLIHLNLQGEEVGNYTYEMDRKSAFYYLLPLEDNGEKKLFLVGCKGVSDPPFWRAFNSQSWALAMMVDENGEVLWQQDNLGSGYYGNFLTWAYKLGDTVVAVGGFHDGRLGSSDIQPVFLEFDLETGRVLRTQRYEIHAHDNGTRQAHEGWINDGIQTADGGFLFVGTLDFVNDRDVWIIRTDANGTLLWEEIFGRPDREEEGLRIFPSGAGTYVILTHYGLFEIGPPVSSLNATLDILGNVYQGEAPFEVFFEISVSGGVPPYTYMLDFDGDGQYEESVLPGQIREYPYTYTRSGIYRPRLRVRDAVGNEVEASLPQELAVCGPTEAQITALFTSGPAPLEVFFDLTNTSWRTCPGESYEWHYDLDCDGDGNFEILHNPTQVWEPTCDYLSPGVYSVVLRVYNGTSYDTADELYRDEVRRENYIVVTGIKAPSEVQVQESRVISNPVNDPTVDLQEAPPEVDLQESEAFIVTATGNPGQCYDFEVTVEREITGEFHLYKLPDWREVSYEQLNEHTLRVTLCCDQNGEIDPVFVLARRKATCTPDGDVAPLGNRDGQVNIGDALVALRFALGLETPSDEDKCHADVAPLGEDGKPHPDGRITIGDALVILRKALRLVNF